MFLPNKVNHTKIFEKSMDQTITRSDIEYLLDEDNIALPQLMRSASAIRDHGKGNVITYSPKVFIPLTKLCRDTCGYCTFRKDPGDVSLYMSPEEILRLAKSGEDLGCTEALFTLGERPEQKYPEAKRWLKNEGFSSTSEYLIHCSEIVLNEGIFPHTNAGNLTKNEMRELQKTNVSMGVMLESSSPRLREKGMPHEDAPSKDPSARLEILKNSGEWNDRLIRYVEYPVVCSDFLTSHRIYSSNYLS